MWTAKVRTEHRNRDQEVHGEREQEGSDACDLEGPSELSGLLDRQFIFERLLLLVANSSGQVALFVIIVGVPFLGVFFVDQAGARR